jgi:tyrosinase
LVRFCLLYISLAPRADTYSNIDRLFALWQTLNPDKWFHAGIQRPFDQKVIGMGDVVTEKTPMRPFHKDEAGTVWMPADARDWYKLGYTYPDLQPWNEKAGTDTKMKLLGELTETYGINRKQALAMAQNPQDVPGAVEIKDRNPEWNKDRESVAMNDYALSIKYSKSVSFRQKVL